MKLQQAIRDCVEEVGDPLMSHIVTHVGDGYTRDEIREEVLAMVNRGELRMKEDSVDHEWSYRKGRNW